MARNTTLVKLIDDLRSEARLSLNPAHNAQARTSQVTALQREQQRLWSDFDWPHMRVERQVEIQAGQRFYDTPEDLDIDRIEKIELFCDGLWHTLLPGIDGAHYSAWNSDLGERAWPPRRWKIGENEDIEIWPISDLNANPVTRDGFLKFTGIRKLRPLVADSDRADLDDVMLVGFVAAQMLAATGAKDAKVKLDAANARYARVRGRLTPSKTFRMFGVGEPKPDNRLRVSHYKPAGT